jgi:hypothetical protein
MIRFAQFLNKTSDPQGLTDLKAKFDQAITNNDNNGQAYYALSLLEYGHQSGIKYVESHGDSLGNKNEFWIFVLAKTTEVTYDLIFNQNMNVNGEQSKKLQNVLVYLISKEHVTKDEMQLSFNLRTGLALAQLNEYPKKLNSAEPDDNLNNEEATDPNLAESYRLQFTKNIDNRSQKSKDNLVFFINSVINNLPQNPPQNGKSQQLTDPTEGLDLNQAPRSETSESTCSRVYKWLTNDFKGWEAVPKIAAWALLILAGVGIVLLGVVAVSTLIDARKQAFVES